jgi:phosphate acetyltransferase
MNDLSTPPLSDLIENVTFDELQVGQRAEFSRTLNQDDITAFAAVSGDVNPAHLDPVYAGQTPFHGVVAHGMWSAALISQLLGNTLPGPGTIYLGQTLQFLQPVRIGDRLHISATVAGKNASNRHVLLNCEIRNQYDKAVLTGVATVIAPAEKVRRPRTRLPQLHLTEPPRPYAALLERVAGLAPVRCAVIHPCDEASLRGALEAQRLGMILPVIVAPAAKVRALAASAGLPLEQVELVDVPHSHAAAARGAAMAAAGEVGMLMKGSLHTDELMAAVLAEPGLRTGRRLTHVFRLEVPLYDKALLISDGALNITPTLLDKADIVQNAIILAQALGVATPRVAILSAVETVTPKIASTVDAAALCKMAQRGQIRGGILDGPLAFDNAISAAAAHSKGIVSDVAGQADILIAPDLEAGNLIAKQLEYLAGADSCGLVLGARVPIALTSRSDGPAARAASAALGLLMAHHQLTTQGVL